MQQEAVEVSALMEMGEATAGRRAGSVQEIRRDTARLLQAWSVRLLPSPLLLLLLLLVLLVLLHQKQCLNSGAPSLLGPPPPAGRCGACCS